MSDFSNCLRETQLPPSEGTNPRGWTENDSVLYHSLSQLGRDRNLVLAFLLRCDLCATPPSNTLQVESTATGSVEHGRTTSFFGGGTCRPQLMFKTWGVSYEMPHLFAAELEVLMFHSLWQ